MLNLDIMTKNTKLHLKCRNFFSKLKIKIKPKLPKISIVKRFLAQVQVKFFTFLHYILIFLASIVRRR